MQCTHLWNLSPQSHTHHLALFRKVTARLFHCHLRCKKLSMCWKVILDARRPAWKSASHHRSPNTATVESCFTENVFYKVQLMPRLQCEISHRVIGMLWRCFGIFWVDSNNWGNDCLKCCLGYFANLVKQRPDDSVQSMKHTLGFHMQSVQRLGESNVCLQCIKIKQTLMRESLHL